MSTTPRSLLASFRRITLSASIAFSLSVGFAQSSTSDFSYRQSGNVGRPTAAPNDLNALPETHPPEFRTVSLVDAIRWALDAIPIVKTLDRDVEIERATLIDPSIAGLRVGQEVAAFDPEIAATYQGGQFNQPPSSFIGPGIETETRFDEGNFGASVRKRWGLGTTASLSYDPSLAYLFFPETNTSSFNPAHSSRFTFEVRQPLLNGGGRAANLAGIRIAKAQRDQSQFETEAAVLARIRSVEQAYWELRAAISAWQIVGSVIPLSEEIVRIEELRLRAKRTIYSDLARARVNLESLRRRQATAWNDVRSAELALRELIALPATEHVLLMPSDTPTPVFEPIDVVSASQVAVERRPDLRRQQLELAIKDFQLDQAKNGVRPTLDMFFRYRVAGLSDGLDNSFDQLFDFDYTDWIVGAEFAIPLGNRRARAELEAADLELAREAARLCAEEDRVRFRVAKLAVQIRTDWERFESARRQLHETEEWVRVAKVRFDQPPPSHGKDSLLLALLDYETAINRHVDSVSSAADLMAEYQTGIARLYEEQGTGFDRWQVHFERLELLNSDPSPEYNQPVIPVGHSVTPQHGWRQPPR